MQTYCMYVCILSTAAAHIPSNSIHIYKYMEQPGAC